MAKLVKFDTEVIRNEFITPTVFELEIRQPDDFSFEAGQFVQFALDDPRQEGKALNRSYSILSAPEEENLRFCIKLVEEGMGTPQLAKLKAGDKIKVKGPLGRFTYNESDRKPFFIATGTGIAPFYSMLKSMTLRKLDLPKAIVIEGVRYEEEVLYDSFFRELKGIQWIPSVSRPKGEWSGYTGRITNYFLQLIDFPFSDYNYYLCGNGAIIKQIKAMLMEKGVEKNQIFQEIYFT